MIYRIKVCSSIIKDGKSILDMGGTIREKEIQVLENPRKVPSREKIEEYLQSKRYGRR